MALLPSTLTAGTTTKVLLHDLYAAKYPEADGWELVLRLQNAKGLLSWPAISVSGFWNLLFTDGSLQLIAGQDPILTAYELQAIHPTEGTLLLGKGRLTLAPALSAASDAKDARTHAERVLDAIRATIEKRASKLQEQYTVDGVELRYTPIKDLLELERRYTNIVAQEQRLQGGLPLWQRVKIGLE